MGDKARVLLTFCVLGACCGLGSPAQAQAVIPETHVTALNGRDVALPKDLPAPATVLILGFGRHSQDATTAWEKPTRTQLARPGSVGFFDMAMLAEVPGLVRPFVLRAVRHAVPDVLAPNFLPLTESEDAWKRVAGYVPDQPDAAYIMLVDRSGHIRWSTHAPFSPAGWAELRHRAEQLAANS